ncbi:Protein transport protein S9 plasma membrane t-SNARE [Coemansia sp. RSA 1722]|nr:Protein transport protein S9 plasma membrane t-SNARE [Coemansia sp. RSA 485]KAJ2588034.1 Protein transport protein S9 plasma membrane t-SNARE [Coemansia sp. RSA 1722]
MSSYRSSPGASYSSSRGDGDAYNSGSRYNSDADRRTPRSGPGGSYGAPQPSGGYSSNGARPAPGGYTSRYGSGNGAATGGSPLRSSNGTPSGSGRSDTRAFAAASRDNRGQHQYGPSKYGAGNGHQQRQYSAAGQADEDSDEDFDTIKSKINEVKGQTLDSTRRALRTLEQTEEVGIKTLTKLGEQSEQLHSINSKMEMANLNAENSVESTSKLRTLNKSIFHVHVKNPFGGKKRREQELMKLEAEQERIRAAKEREHQDKTDSRQRVNRYISPGAANFRGPAGVMDANSGDVVASRSQNPGYGGPRSRYMLEDEDPEIEQEIDSNINQMSDALSRLKGLAVATSKELDSQSKPMKNIAELSDRTSDNIGIATFHLNKVNKK